MNIGTGNFLNLFIEYFPRVVVLLVCLPIHEISHAFTANAYGDDTPRLHGRLTLNPFAHLDVLGSFLILFQGFGWAKPVPINPAVLRSKSPSALMWVSLAGPLSNLALAVITFFPLRILVDMMKAQTISGVSYSVIIEILYNFLIINLLLSIFNLIPLAPLDGEKVLEFFLPPQAIAFFDRIRPYAPLVLLGVFIILPYMGIHVFDYIMSPIRRGVLYLLGVN
jgi:Zn-dependent protease